jgi:hypothetical protein
MIGLAGKLLSCALDALPVGDVDLEECNLTFFAKFFFRGAAGFLIARAQENMKTFAREVARDFETNPFVRPGDERDSSFSCHEQF